MNSNSAHEETCFSSLSPASAFSIKIADYLWRMIFRSVLVSSHNLFINLKYFYDDG